MSAHPKDRVLVVDDDDAIRTMVERVLKRERYDVESARDGHEAIQKLSEKYFGTVVLDLMMPRVDGHGVLRFLDQEHRGPAPRVIVMTANMQGAEAAERARATFRVLSKPFEIHELIENVRRCSASAEPISGDARAQL